MANALRRAGPVPFLVLGALLSLAYFVWLYLEPRGPFEFAYAPFTPEPLPYSAMRGFTYEQLWGHVARFALLGPGLACLSYGVFRLRPFVLPEPGRPLLVWAAALGVALCAFVLFVVLRGRTISDDELVYRMQATFLSEGRISGADSGVTPPDLFSIATRDGYTGKYLPGEPLLQIPGLFVGIPALLHLPVFALTLFAFYRALFPSGQRLAVFSTLALALSPMALLTTATGLTQALSLCCCALTGLGFEWARRDRPLAGALLAGIAIAAGLSTRLQAMLPFGAVFGLALVVVLTRRRHFGALLALAGTLALGLGMLGAYNAAVSGSPFTLPWYLQCSIEHFGFGRVWSYDSYQHTPLTGLENLLVVLVRLNAWWLGFPCSLLVLGLWWWLGRPLHGQGVWLWAGLAIFAFEFLYYSPGASDTGAIYHYELLLPGALLAGAVATACFARFPALTSAALAVHAALGTLPFFAEQTLRLQRLVAYIHTDSDAALARITAPALLFHEWHDGEVRVAGWVFDSFPRRYRGKHDPIVTFPWLPAADRARIAALYPGRSCWYYRRDPTEGRAELQRCEAAGKLLDRSEGERQSERTGTLWERPTAYSRTPYSPFEANSRRRLHNAQGHRIFGCCALQKTARLGGVVRPELFAACVKDGP